MMSNKDELYYYLGFSHFYGIGPTRFSSLLKHFGSAKTAYMAKQQELTRIIGRNWAEKFTQFRTSYDPEKKLEELKRKDISVIISSSRSYPRYLKEIADPPICLYAKGDIKSFFSSTDTDIYFAVVGTRTPTQYGRQIAKKLSSELVEAGFVIVSGMAVGIDSIAHWAALDSDKKTIAVLGCGVDIIYPGVNRKLYYEIIEKGGLIISEFPPGQYMEKGLFVARNRIISGLSKGTLVIEGAEDSGALITARYAAEQGKDVFASPGPINSSMSEAPNLLIKQGAKLVTTVEDIFEELGIKITPVRKEKIELQLTGNEKKIFDLLQQETLAIDDIAMKTNKIIAEIIESISTMEIKGVIEKNNEGKYQIRLNQ